MLVFTPQDISESDDRTSGSISIPD